VSEGCTQKKSAGYSEQSDSTGQPGYAFKHVAEEVYGAAAISMMLHIDGIEFFWTDPRGHIGTATDASFFGLTLQIRTFCGVFRLALRKPGAWNAIIEKVPQFSCHVPVCAVQGAETGLI